MRTVIAVTDRLPGVEGTPDRRQGALLASVFSPVTVRGLAREDVGAAAPRLQILAELMRAVPGASVGDAFDAAHRLLSRGYRSEYVFKNDIVSRVVFGRHSPRTASALVEQPTGESIADVMVLNGTTTIYEVKTDLDQFTRLAGQLRDYCSRAEFVNVVTSPARVAAAAAATPEHVGIIALQQRRGQLTTFRAAQSNLARLNVAHLFRFLRTAEVQAVLRQTHAYEPNSHQGLMWEEMEHLFMTLPIPVAHNLVLQQLRTRADSLRDVVTAPELPESLRALMYTQSPSKVGVRRLRERLRLPVALFLG
ncbi:hypothetical protein Csp2054_05220 [Curtobacterium sp. 'Ferrero']|nr:hypothetical protein Csp2054_05220 [Curtobacterium sp. 'Ferrero']